MSHLDLSSALPALNPSYLEGIHRKVEGESDRASLELIDGEVPHELSGLFARNSPNPQFEPQGKYHWFDGDGMVHALNFNEGVARYRCRYVQTEELAQERDAGHALWRGILEPPQPGLSRPLKDTANTDLTWHNGQLIASWWLSGTPKALSPDLETLGDASFTADLPRGASVAAHPKVDPNTGEMMFFGYSLFKRPYYGYGVVKADGTLAHYTPIETPRPHIPHDIAITPQYTVLIDLPLGWDREAMRRGKRKIGFDRNTPARFGVIPRYGHSSEVKWFEASTCYMYHTIRAFERGDELILTGCRIEDPIPDIPDESQTVARLDIIHLVPHLYQWRFNLKTGAVHEERLDRTPTEFPRVNDQTLTQQTRYSYNPTIAQAPTLCFDGVIRYDLEGGRQEHFRYPSGWFGGEVCFAPDPQRLQREDGGWVISVISHPDGLPSRALILDAERVSEGPVATLKLPHAIPVGFHAEWAPLS